MVQPTRARAHVHGAIVFATAGGTEAVSARRVALDMSRRSGGDLHVVLVWDERVAPGALSHSAFEQASQSALHAETTSIQHEGGSVAEAHLVHGRAVDGILRIVRRIQPWLVVVGSHEHGVIGRLFENSVSEAVVRRSSVPVLVDGAGHLGWPPLRVVIAIDATNDARFVAAAGAQIAQLLAVPVRIVNVHQDLTQRAAVTLVGDIVEIVQRRTDRRPTVVSATGDVLDEVIRAAGRQPALVVAGRRWAGRFDASHGRQVSTQLLHRYPGPCVFVPRPTSEAIG